MKFILPIFLLIFTGCVARLMPISNAINVYDAYSISRDQRGIYSITKDKIIQTKIQSKILFDKDLSLIDVDVESFYGDVYLIGLIKDDNVRKKIVNIAKTTDGVKKIYTYLKIKKDDYPCSSFNILANLKRELFSDSSVEGTNVRVSVVGCDVVFSGVVADVKQEEHAIWYARHTEGVDEVYSFLKILD